MVGIILIACKQDKSEYVQPIFSIFAQGDPNKANASRRFVDSQRRSYKSWDDWKENNTMPMMKYAYPRRGFFTSSTRCEYEFDPDKEPDIEFATSPQCAFSSRFFRQTDTISAVTSLGCGVVAVASFFTPVGFFAPALLMSCAVGGGTSAVYGTTR